MRKEKREKRKEKREKGKEEGVWMFLLNIG